MSLRARWAVGMLLTSAVIALVVVLTVFRVGLTGVGQRSLPGQEGAWRLTLFAGLVRIGTIVAWLVWQHGANRRLRDSGVEGLEFNPSSSVWWWFVPFANLSMPYRAMGELWRASEPTASRDDWKSARLPSLLGIWWGTFILSSVLFGVSARTGDEDMSLILIGAGDLFAIVAAASAIPLVLGIDARMAVRTSTGTAIVHGIAPVPETPAAAVLPPPTAGKVGVRRAVLIGVPALAVIVLASVAIVLIRASGDYWDSGEAFGGQPIYREGASPQISEALHDEFRECGLGDDDIESAVSQYRNSTAPRTGSAFGIIRFHEGRSGIGIDVETFEGRQGFLIVTCDRLGGQAAEEGEEPGPPSGRVAFRSNREGNGNIYVMNPDGNGLTQITDHTNADIDPFWSPDGKRITFIRLSAPTFGECNPNCSTDIYLVDGDGRNEVQLTNTPESEFEPAWSPDGKRIAFTVGLEDSEIFVMNSDGGDRTQLTRNSVEDFSAVWSPDGKRLVFSSGTGGSSDVLVMNADGSDIQELTETSEMEFDPAWSPDGKKIAFARGDFEFATICIMNSDGSNVRRLEETTGKRTGAPAWSPDGKWIMYANANALFLVAADGGSTQPVSGTSEKDGSPAWRSGR